MGKTLTFFKQLLGFKTNDSPISEPNKQLKRRWSFGKSRKGLHDHTKSTNGNSLDRPHYNLDKNEDPNKRAIALAAATAAVVDAAVAAAQAAAEVVRMTGGTIGYAGARVELAAIKIQSYFRAYLARKALRALKALVRLQAVVRGHILRKQTADMMRRLQALIRAQERACAVRSQINGSTTKHSHFHHHGPPTPEKIVHFPHTKRDHRSISKRNGSKSYVRGITGQERTFLDGSTYRENDKVVEVDTAKSHVTTNGRKLFHSFQHSNSLTTSRGSTFQPTSSSPCAPCEVNSFYYSMRGAVSTLAKSEGSRSCISSFWDHPNYMAYTKSSRAKVRSLSAPRLRPQLEVSNLTRRDSGYKYVMGMQRGPTTRDSFVRKTYPGSARLDQLRLPVYDTEDSEYCDGYWN